MLVQMHVLRGLVRLTRSMLFLLLQKSVIPALVQASCLLDSCFHCKEISELKQTIGNLVSQVESLQLQVISLQDRPIPKFKSGSNHSSLSVSSQNKAILPTSLPPSFMRSYPITSVRDFSRPIVRPGQYPPCGDLSNPGAWSSGGQELSASFPPSYACIAQRGVKSVHRPRKSSGSSSSVVQSEAQSKSPSFRILWGTRLSFSVDDIFFSLSSIFDDETHKSIRVVYYHCLF